MISEFVSNEHLGCSQACHGGAFEGNHIHRALKRNVRKVIVQYRWPQRGALAYFKMPSPSPIVSTKAGDISQFLSCDPVAELTLNTLDETITRLMSTAHNEVAQRKRGNITAKLHDLESHLVPWIGRFRVGLGLLGELCAESIHTMSSAPRRTFDSVVNTLKRKSDRQPVHRALYFATARRR